MATRYPARMLASILNDGELIKDYSKYFKYGEMEIKNLFKQLDAGINVGKTTSTGRVLDSMAVALEIAHERTYEGECSMKLESAAREGFDMLDMRLSSEIVGDKIIINTSELLLDVIDLIDSGVLIEEIAVASQRALAEKLSELAIKVAKSRNVDVIGVTGGVFYNEFISNVVKTMVTLEDLTFKQHEQTCAGDGSVSMGQCAVVGWQKSFLK
jgi:hydrogenase maturation protein HypF